MFILYNVAMNEERWISTQEASDLTGYNTEHIRRLVRDNLVTARKFGPLWQVDRFSLLDYLNAAASSSDKRYGPHLTNSFDNSNI